MLFDLYINIIVHKAFSNEPENIGLSILRIHIDPDENRFSDQIPTALYATDKGAKVFATPWDPPANLVDNSSGRTKLGYNFGGWFSNALMQSFDTVDTPTIATGSTGDTIFYARWDSMTGVANFETNTTLIYLNPTNGIIHITRNSDIQIYSLSSTLLKEYTNTNQVDITRFEPGIYFVRIYNSDGIYAPK